MCYWLRLASMFHRPFFSVVTRLEAGTRISWVDPGGAIAQLRLALHTHGTERLGIPRVSLSASTSKYSLPCRQNWRSSSGEETRRGDDPSSARGGTQLQNDVDGKLLLTSEADQTRVVTAYGPEGEVRNASPCPPMGAPLARDPDGSQGVSGTLLCRLFYPCW